MCAWPKCNFRSSQQMSGDNKFVSLNLKMYLWLKQCPLAAMDQFSVPVKIYAAYLGFNVAFC